MAVQIFLFLMLLITSLNVRSVKSEGRCKTVLHFLGTVNTDVVFLQECGLSFRDNYVDMERMWVHGESVWSGGNGCRAAGVGILFKNRNFVMECKEVIECGRMLVVDVNYLGKALRFINVYASPDKEERFELFKEIRKLLDTTRVCILAGDFNTVLKASDRRTNPEGVKLDKTSIVLNELVIDFRLLDVLKVVKPSEDVYTWVSDDGTKASRIDFIFSSSSVQWDKCDVVPVFFTDHCMVTARMEVEGVCEVGKGVWKLNVELLEDERLGRKFKHRYEEWQTVKDMYGSVSEWWECVKERIKKFFMAEGKIRAAKGRKRINGLQCRLEHLFKLQKQGFPVNDDIKEIKSKLKELFEKRCKAVMFRSKVQYIEENEKCTRFFYKKIVDKKKAMTGLKDEDGNIKKDTKRMIEVVEDFYSTLYKEKNIEENVMDEFLEELDCEVDGGESLKKPLDLKEVTEAMKSFKLGKAPGRDGLPREFYSKFWEVVGPDILMVYNEIIAVGEMPPSFREGIITLIFKKNNREELKNWRPISLLNFDYKCLAKILTSRIKAVIDSVIHPDQTCAVPGRRITDSLILLRDSVFYAHDRNYPLCILNLDLEKAYDRVSHKFMLRVLGKMGFPASVVKWVDLLYKNIQSRVLVNGVLSKVIPIKCGVRQGCPLSPILFICCLEPLVNVLRKDKMVKGMPVPGGGGRMVKVLAYMDDVTVLCSDRRSIRRTLLHTERYGLASGAKLNKEKSECMFYGNWPEAPDCDVCIKTDSIKVLGLKFDGTGSGQRNWVDVGAKVSQKLGLWSLRNLTMEGKVLVLKSIILPMLFYIAVVFPPTTHVLKILNRTVFCFFWGTKSEKIRRNVVVKNALLGGKQFPDLNLVLIAKYVVLHVHMCLFGKCTAALFLRFYMGAMLRSFKMYNVPLTVPTVWEMPFNFSLIKKFIVKNELKNIGKEYWEDYRKVIRLVQSKDTICPVRWYTADQVEMIWIEVAHPKLLNMHRDLAWLIVHEALPVRQMMYGRRMAKSPRCPRQGCGAEESAEHLLVNCSFAQHVWTEADIFVKEYCEGETVNEPLILYGKHNVKMNKSKWYVLWAILNSFKDAIWRARNVLVFRNAQLSSSDCVRLAMSILKDYVIKDYRKSGKQAAERMWKLEKWFGGQWAIGIG